MAHLGVVLSLALLAPGGNDLPNPSRNLPQAESTTAGTPAQTCVPAPTGVISWWAGDGDAVDPVGGNDGSLLNGTSFSAGFVDQAFQFDGVDDLVFVPNSPSLEPASLTIEAWVRSNDPGGVFRYLLTKGLDDCNAASYALFTTVGSNRLAFYIYDPPTSTTTPWAGPGVWDGGWHHIAGTFDGSFVRLYVDGAEIGPGTPASHGIGYGLPTNNDLYIGRYNNSGCIHDFDFAGEMDEITIYDRALTESEIQVIVNAGAAGKCKVLTVTTRSLSAVRLGEPSSRQLEVAAGDPPYSWSVSAGNLPPGMSLGTDGVLGGAPTTLGPYTFTVNVVDGHNDMAQRELTLDVVLVLPPPDIHVEKVGTRAVPGRVLDYFILVRNVGDVAAVGSSVIEFLNPPSFFTYETADPLPDIVNESSIVWDLPTVEPQQSHVIQYQARLDPTVPLGTTVTGFALFAKDKCRRIEGFRLNIVHRQGLECADPAILTAAQFFCDLAFEACPPCPSPSVLPEAFNLAQCVQRFNECSSALEAALRNCDAGKQVPEGHTVNRQTADGPIDPNEKCVSAGTYIQPDQLLLYPIHFENIGQIEALDVFVTDVLDPNLDESTLEIISPGGSYDSPTRTLSWDLLGINLQPAETGHVSFSALPLPGLPSGTVIQNGATIQFEVFDIIPTTACGDDIEGTPVVNVIDTTPPSCTMDPLPAQTTSLNVPISWSGTDAIGQIDAYSIYVSADGGVFAPVTVTDQTGTTFSGQSDTSYGFLCVASDTAGNVEAQGLTAETITQTCLSADGDPSCVADDCDDTDPAAYPDALEVNDGLDNQCPGDDGFGLVDETSGNSGFVISDDPDQYSWTAQPGATLYEVARSSQPDFSAGCVSFTTPNAFLVDTASPLPGEVFHYLNRAVLPNVGSWGRSSAGAERMFDCP